MRGDSEAERERKRKNALIEVSEFARFDFGPEHPFKIHRLQLVFKLIEAYRLTRLPGVYLVKPRPATEEEALTFHSSGYLEVLKLSDSGMWTPQLFDHGLGPGDNPVFSGVYDWAMLVAGSSIVAAEELLAERARIAFNIAGGLHHAMPSRASGFCHINDVVLAINKLLQQKERVAYVDIDAHHGDGVQQAFYSTDKVLTISVHESGYYLFPGSGFVDEIGSGAGTGYSVNIPLRPGARDDAFQRALEEIVIPLLQVYRPDVLVTQLGVDALRDDPVAQLGFTLDGFLMAIKAFKDNSTAAGRPWLALGGGGYNLKNVVRAWTLAWAVMNDAELQDRIPGEWNEFAARYGVQLDSLYEQPDPTPSPLEVLQDLEQTIRELKRKVFPIHGLA